MAENLRMRVFAGPNGSGKSTIIKYIRSQTVNDKPIDFGIYINADDIAEKLKEDDLDFSAYTINTNAQEFKEIALQSGLLTTDEIKDYFECSFSFARNSIKLESTGFREHLAQIIADFLRKKLIQEKKKFSFETVFSHVGKLDLMREAKAEGYKVYLYFVATESSDINVYRVEARTHKGGHDVPEDKIRSRYDRSLNLLYEASQLAYQAFYFDNSEDGLEDVAMFAHFKLSGDTKKWDIADKKNVPVWFRKYYSEKIAE